MLQADVAGFIINVVNTHSPDIRGFQKHKTVKETKKQYVISSEGY